MEPKVIGVISRDLEIIRKVVEGRSEETKKTFHDIIVGTEVQAIVQSVLDKMDEMKEVSVQMDESMNRVRTIIKKNNDLIAKDESNEKLLETLVEISANVAAIMKKSGTPKISPETKKSMDKLLIDAQKNPKMDRIMQMVSLLSQLKELSIKDFLFAKTKIKHLEKVYDQVESIMTKYKDEKQIKKVHEFVNSSTKLVKELSKIVPLTKLAQIGAKGLDKILFGKGGLVSLFSKINKEEKTIKKSKKNLDLIMGGCRKIAELALILSAMIVLAPIAMLGVLFCVGLLWTMTLLSKFLESQNKTIDKGNISIGKLMLGMLFLAGSIILIYQGVKNMEWKTFGKMVATIGLLVGVTFIVGELQKPIAKGAVTMMLMGVAYTVVGISLMVLYNSVKGAEWGEFGMLAATIGLLVGVTLVAGIAPISGFIMMGAVALMLMGAAYTVVGISLMLMYNSVKGAKWSEFGMIAATIGTFVAIATGVGVPIVAGLVALGSLSLMILGGALISLGLGISIFGALVKDSAIEKVAVGIPKIMKAITSIFSSDKENPSFGDGILGIIIGALKVGGAFFAAGALIFIGFALGILGLALKPWENLKTKAIDNVEYTINKLNKIFKLDDNGEGASLTGIASGYLGIITAALSFGKTLFQMGTILLVAFTMGLIYDSLNKWKDFDMKSIDNFEIVYGKIRKIFKLDDDSNKGLGGLVKGYFGLMTSVLSFGKTLFQMGIVLLCTYTMSLIYDSLDKWKNFDKKSIDNFELVYTKLQKIFKLDDDSNKGLGGLVKGYFGLMTSVLSFGKTLFHLGILLLATYSMNLIYDNLERWKDFDMKSIDNFETVYLKLQKIFKLDDEGKKGIGGLFKNLVGAGSALLNMGGTFMRMGTLLMAVYTMNLIYDNLDKWKNFDQKSIDNFELTVNRLNSIFETGDFKKSVKGAKSFDKMIKNVLKAAKRITKNENEVIKFKVLSNAIITTLDRWSEFDYIQRGDSMGNTLEKLFSIIERPGLKYAANTATTIKLLNTLKKMEKFNGTSISNPVKMIVDAVNRIQMDKIDALTDMFKAFSKMKNRSIFAPFENSVEQFTRACIRLIEAINGNTDALNADDDVSATSSASSENRGTAVSITNIEELAEMLAEHIGKFSGGGYISSAPTTVELRINGQGGDRWVLSRY